MFSAAYLLLAHGSRDLRTTAALGQLACACQKRMGDHMVLLGTAVLELGELPIDQQIVLFAEQAAQTGYHQVKILPLFLAPGVHVLSDLPVAVAAAQHQIAELCTLELLPYLGASQGLREILQQHRQLLPTSSIFLAHGSRQPAAIEFLQKMATDLSMEIAYWSGSPQLPARVAQLASHQPSAVGIMPYFLFPGHTSTAITTTLNELQSLFPTIQFSSTDLLGANSKLIDLLVNLLLGKDF